MADRIRRPEDEEKARERSIESYRNLVDHMFKNVLNDTKVVLEASKAYRETAKICDEEGDVARGQNLVDMFQALHDAAEAIKERYIEQFDGAVISDVEWSKLDGATRELEGKE